jgi:hypothetical protein
MLLFLTPSAARFRSEMTPEGRRTTQLDTILLNGNNIAIVRAHTTGLACAVDISQNAR